MKRFFLVDTENTGKQFLNGLEQLSVKDTVVLFNYAYGSKILMEVMYLLSSVEAKVEIKTMRIHTKNAMDFQIVSYLGLLASKHGNDAEYYILSNDKGYAAAIEFLEDSLEKGIVIKMAADFSRLTKTEHVREIINSTLAGYPKKVRREAAYALTHMNNKKDLHQYLQKNLGRDGAGIYQIIKPLYEELKSA